MKVKENGVLGLPSGKTSWFSRLIAEGSGSSAYYPGDALRESGPAAFPVGTHIHADHQTMRERTEHPEKSVKSIIGVIASTPVFLEEGETTNIGDKTFTADKNGLYAVTEFLDEWAPFVEQVGKFLGLSIDTKALLQEGVQESSLPVVKEFIVSPLTSVDLVTAPGADGLIGEAIESFKEHREEAGMTPEDIKAVAKAVTEAIVPALTEALQPEPVEVDHAAVVEALVSAELPKAARAKVYAAIESGVEVATAIESEKTYIRGITESLEASGVFKGSEKKADTDNYTVAGW